jgi:hypothetical protein
MNSLDVIPPLLKDITDYDLNQLGPVDFSYRVLCCHVAIERGGRRDVMHIVEPQKPGSTLALEFNGTSGRLQIPEEISKAIIEEAQARASRH